MGTDVKYLKYALPAIVLPLIATCCFVLSAHAQVYNYFGPGCALSGTATQQTVNLNTGACIAGNLPPTNLNSGTSANSTTFWRGDGIWATPPGTGGGTVNSVSLTTPSFFTVTGSPITNTGTLAITATTGQIQNGFLAAPSGSTGALSVRAIVGADVPAINLAASGAGGVTGNLPVTNLNSGTSAAAGTYWSGAGTWTTPAGTTAAANPTGTVGLTAVNGSATTFLRSDGAPALGTTISPTMTGNWTFTPASGVALTSNGVSGTFADQVNGNSASGNSRGLLIKSGTTSADYALYVENQSAGSTFLQLFGDGGMLLSTATGGDKGLGTLNATGLFVNGAAVSTSAPSSANPSALVQLTAVNGSASTFMTSDSAPALNQAIAPTWSGVHTFQGSGTGAFGQSLFDAPTWTSANTSRADGIQATASTVAGSYTLPEVDLFQAQFSTKGAGSAITSLIGYHVDAGVGGVATNAAAFQSDIASAANQYAFLANGTAQSKFLGPVISSPATGTPITLGTPSTGYFLLGLYSSPTSAQVSSFGTDTSDGLGRAAVQFTTTTDGAGSDSQIDLITNKFGVSRASRMTISPVGGVTIPAPAAAATTLQLTAISGSGAEGISGASTTNNSFGLFINAGTSSSDNAVNINNFANTHNFEILRGDGSGQIGYNGSVGTIQFSAAGNVTIPSPSSGSAFTSTGVAGGSFSTVITSPNTAGSSNGLRVQAGTNATDNAFLIANAGGSNLFAVQGSGNTLILAPASGTTLALTGASAGAGMSIAAHGVSPTGIAITGDAAQQLNAISITQGAQSSWFVYQPASSTDLRLFEGADRIVFPATGGETINAPTSGNALNVTGLAGSYAAEFNGASGAGNSFGELIDAGTNSSDWGFLIQDQTAATNYLKVFGDGGVVVGAATGGDKGVGTVNATNLYVNGNAVTTISSGTFSGTLAGFSGSPTVTCYYNVAGQAVTLSCEAAAQTSNSASMSISGIPTVAKGPSTSGVFLSSYNFCEDNGTSPTACQMNIAGTTLVFGKGTASSGGFTTTGTKGFSKFSVTYTNQG